MQHNCNDEQNARITELPYRHLTAMPSPVVQPFVIKQMALLEETEIHPELSVKLRHARVITGAPVLHG